MFWFMWKSSMKKVLCFNGHRAGLVFTCFELAGERKHLFVLWFQVPIQLHQDQQLRPVCGGGYTFTSCHSYCPVVSPETTKQPQKSCAERTLLAKRWQKLGRISSLIINSAVTAVLIHTRQPPSASSASGIINNNNNNSNNSTVLCSTCAML